MNVKTWIPLVLAVAMGLVALMVARKALHPSDHAAGPSNVATVVVAKRDVPVGRELTPDDLSVTRVAADATPTRSFNAVPLVVGRTVTTQLVKGQTVVDTLLAPAGSGAGLTALVEPGQRAITIEVNEITGLAGMLVPNSRVDVICSVRDEKAQQNVARTILQNIRVLATGRQMSATVPEGQPVPPPANNVTLLVTQKQAQALQLASQGARPWLVLRSPRDGDELAAAPTSMAELRGDGDLSPAPAPVLPVLAMGPTTGPATPAAPKSRDTQTVQVINGGVMTQIEVPVAKPQTGASPVGQEPQPAPLPPPAYDPTQITGGGHEMQEVK